MVKDGRRTRRARQFAMLGAAILIALSASARVGAQSLEIDVDATYAEYLLEHICAGKPVDEAYLRASPAVQNQIAHHSNLSERRNFAAFLSGLQAAAECRVPENDVYRFGAVVENKAAFEAAVTFFTARAPEIERFVVKTLQPYTPQDLRYRGKLILSIVGNPCGGFARAGSFYVALNCLTGNMENELEAVKVVSAHEVYHDIQYAFAFPAKPGIREGTSRDEAFGYYFRALLMEGTAEYVADSRRIAGNGTLTGYLQQFTANGYAQQPLHLRLFSYGGEILAGGEDYMRRLKDVYQLGFTGDNRQIFYYAGAAMADHIEQSYDRETLLCVMHQPAEQFVRAYQMAAVKRPDEKMPPMGQALMAAADRLSATRAAAQRFEHCLEK